MAPGPRRQLNALVLATATLFAGVGVARADEASLPEVSNIEELSIEDLLNVQVASATKLETPARETPAIMSVVTRDQIDSYGWLSVNDVLFRQPGFAPSQDYDRVTVTARGLFEGWNNNHLLLLIDGVPYNDNLYGTAFTWEITPMVLVRSMEIIRGPGSALYGSSATNGVVALNTRSVVGSAAEATVRFGNAGTRIYDLFVGHNFKPFSFVVAYNHFETDGNTYNDYDGSGRTDASGKLLKLHVGDARSSDYLFAKVEANGKLRGLSLQFHWQSWRFETGHGWIWYIPDIKEQMGEERQIVSLAYKPPALFNERFKQEYVVQYQRHAVDWHIKFLPDNTQSVATDGSPVLLPQGLHENLNTDAHSVFMRAQFSYKFWREMAALAGIEDSVFLYTGDSLHTANVDINNGGTGLPLATQQPLRPELEYVQNKPVNNLGVYLQYSSGRVLRRLLSVTTGLRYDLQYFKYSDINEPARPTLSRSFNQLSPRIGIVAFPWRDLALKFAFDQAFRAPAPAELFGANTYTLASNIKHLLPESITTISLGGDLLLLRHIDLRANWFYEIFDNEIAYSIANANLSTNIYSRTVTGLESEVQFDAPVGSTGKLSGFFNYSFVHLVDETIQDMFILKSWQLTWAPEHLFNVGANLVARGFNATLQGHYQGTAWRRISDNMPADFSLYRPSSIAPWFTVDARVSYQVTDWLRLGVQATNLFNANGALIKNINYPFDYRIQGVRVLGTLDVDMFKIVAHRPQSID
jgi:outer membrane receptor protein involved in Fe transport